MQTLEQIEKIITDKTTFKNVLLSATLLEVSDEYAFIQSNINKINYDVLDIQGDNVTTKKEILDQIKEDATIYLSDEFINEYNTIKVPHPIVLIRFFINNYSLLCLFSFTGFVSRSALIKLVFNNL